MKYFSDEDCIRRILSGDNRAFAYLVDQHKAMVFTIVLRITESREDAEEIAQDVFLKVYQSLQTFKGGSKFSTWLYSIAYNMSISYVRKTKPTFIPLQNTETDATDDFSESFEIDISDNQQRQTALSQALTSLKQDELLLVNMYYTQQMSIEQISEITELTQSNVKVKLFRIRKKLADSMSVNWKK